MAARRREAIRRNWPANLYQNTKGYYWFRHPETGKTYGLGTDFKAASLQAKAVNAQLAVRAATPALLDRIDGGGKTVSDWIEEYMIPIREKHAGKRTLVNIEYEVAAIASAIGDMQVSAVEPRDIVAMVKETAGRGKSIPPKVRARARSLFREAINQGLVKPGQNPVESTFRPESKVTRERMTLDLFLSVRAEAEKDPDLCWFVNGMNMALITGQRVGDLSRLTKTDVKDGYLWIEQQKTGIKLKIPLDLRLPAIDMSVADVLRNANDRVLSRSIFHYVRSYPQKKIGDQPAVNAYSHVLRKMLAALKYAPGTGKTPTAFHEIRSLSTRLYDELYGKDFAQALMGHKTATMTDRYRDSRGAEWQVIKAIA
ncbi:tyrosine-type recombinase/integrase [Robbsia andropogonis]|uniref:tyrosine-type recombinase/integrase n=1 Tax=Robbsia andropogonis TaxID=28092 RepID=UPI002A69D952|nr:tyrosine-type recombinase/integrase [Robbsia andropogonis]